MLVFGPWVQGDPERELRGVCQLYPWNSCWQGSSVFGLFCALYHPFPPSSHLVLQPVPCLQMLHKVLYDHLGPDDSKGKSKLGMVPQSTMQEFFLPLEAFNLGADTKNGCRVWANNHMFQGKIWRVLNNTHGDPNGLMPFNNIKINQVTQSMSWCLLPCSLSAKFTDCPAHWWVPTRWIPSGSWSSGSQIPSCRWHPDNSPRKCGNKWWIWEDHAHGWNLRIGHQLRCFA